MSEESEIRINNLVDQEIIERHVEKECRWKNFLKKDGQTADYFTCCVECNGFNYFCDSYVTLEEFCKKVDFRNRDFNKIIDFYANQLKEIDKLDIIDERENEFEYIHEELELFFKGTDFLDPFFEMYSSIKNNHSEEKINEKIKRIKEVYKEN